MKKQEELFGSYDRAKALFGGHFAWFDLYSVLYKACEGGVSGFVEITWDVLKFTKSFDPSVEERLLAGKAKIFLAEGFINDVVFEGCRPLSGCGSYDKFIENLSLLLQISYGFGTDKSPEGESVVYATEDYARVKVGSIAHTDLLQIITESTQREKKWLDNYSEDDWADIIE
jgi:hypothetical protein